MVWTWAAVSANNKLWDRANYRLIVKSQYSIPSPNGPSRACLWKTAASLPSIVAEAHGKESQNEGDYHGRDGLRGSCESKALKHQIFIVGYLQIVERKRLHAAPCSTWYEPWTMARKLHRWLSVSGIALKMVPRRHPKAPKEMATCIS
jgi:hypothetical protein